MRYKRLIARIIEKKQKEYLHQWDGKFTPGNFEAIRQATDNLSGWTIHWEGEKTGGVNAKPYGKELSHDGTIKKGRGFLFETPGTKRRMYIPGSGSGSYRRQDLINVVFQLEEGGWLKFPIRFWTFKLDGEKQHVEAFQTPEQKKEMDDFFAECTRLDRIDELVRFVFPFNLYEEPTYKSMNELKYKGLEELKAILKPSDKVPYVIRMLVKDPQHAVEISNNQIRLNRLNSAYNDIRKPPSHVGADWFLRSFRDIKESLRPPKEQIPSDIKAKMREFIDKPFHWPGEPKDVTIEEMDKVFPGLSSWMKERT